MAVSTHVTTATGSGGKDNDGGVIANAGNISSSRHTAKSTMELAQGKKVSGSQMHTVSNRSQAALASGGTFAYNPSVHGTRSSTDTGFLIAGGSPTLLSGKANTGDLLAIPAAHYAFRQSGNIHKRIKTTQKGTWADRTFDILNGTLSKGTNAGTAFNFVSTTNSGNPATDDAASPTRAIPGEFVILTNFVSYTGESASGDGTASETMMDYSAITGG